MFRNATAPRLVALVAAGALALFGVALAEQSTAQPAHAAEAVAYDSIPDYTTPDSWPSLGYSATSTHEFGDLIELDSTAGAVKTVKVGFVSWACQSGAWNTADCVSAEGSTFAVPVTVNIYKPGASTAVGATPGDRITSVTSTVTAPYRPSSDAACADGKYKNFADECVNGEIFVWPFSLPTAVSLPSKVIVTISFQTTNYDGLANGPYNALNVGAVDDAPTVGSNPDSGLVYLQSKSAHSYTDTSFPVDTLHADNGWAPNDVIPLELDSTVPALGDPAPPTPTLPTTDVPEPTASATNASGESLSDPANQPQVASAALTDPPAPGGTIPVVYPAGTFLPFEWVQFVFYSVPQYATAVQANATGGLSASVPVPAGVAAGNHTLAATGTSSGVVATAAVAVAAAPRLAATGVDSGEVWMLGTLGAGALLLGAAALVGARLRRRATH